MRGKCQVIGCNETAKFNLYKTYPQNYCRFCGRGDTDGEKRWLNVCDKHEKEIGDENERRATAKLKC